MTAIAPEIRLLAAHLRPALGLASEEAPPLTLAQAEWAMRRHRVGPLLHHALAGRADGDAAVGALLRGSYERNVRRQLRHRAATQRFTGWLAERGHNALVVKGWELGAALYGDAGLRYSKDIDLLIGAAAMQDALGIAAANGFLVSGKPAHQGMRKARLLIGRFKEIGVGDPDYGVQLELHSRLLVHPPPCWSDPEPGDNNWPSLSNPEYVLYLLIHGAWTYWDRLKWLADGAMLAQRVERELIPVVLANARLLHCEEAIVAGLRMVGDLWGEALVADWLAHSNVPADDALMQRHCAMIAERLGYDARTPFPQRLLRATGIRRNPPVFGTHPPRLRSTIDNALFWMASKL
ncbi:nucleotidyltransferase family protein [Erythrobacter sp. EC-HK427]|uniref:nucleotidyltransferase family protein n=1 Tax=Erythrobacter sp. EC-HK427 TaxID=2038396 RepID=UPI0012532863|nr:nucleotidyltransferase family protein [Erythrobacter sp. EC-HK427]VVT20545.1 conserved hypothetical protein [Erythrobacter sp. EC-HK427]